uniref:Uncharacterized protein n=1 Tax=Aegilops tauschii subsp. strangulata TaxID=200361 RepID=A0A453I000_AEGTS
QYVLHTDVYRPILECRFTHFALYVVYIGISKKDLYLGMEGVSTTTNVYSFMCSRYFICSGCKFVLIN